MTARAATEPLEGCAYVDQGRIVACPTRSFQALMDDTARLELRVSELTGQLYISMQKENTARLLERDLHISQIEEMRAEVDLWKERVAMTQDPTWLEQNKAAITYSAGTFGTAAFALGIGLAAADNDPKLWASFLIAGLVSDLAGAWLAFR